MKGIFIRLLEKLFPVHPHEWQKVLVLLSVATLLGIGFSVSRAASEGLFLTRLGVKYLPTLLLINPLLVLVASVVYGAFADRISNERLAAAARSGVSRTLTWLLGCSAYRCETWR